MVFKGQLGRTRTSICLPFKSDLSSPYFQVMLSISQWGAEKWPEYGRPGDLARIEANVSPVTTSKKSKASTDTKGAQEGVVYKVFQLVVSWSSDWTFFQVSDSKITIAIDASESDSDDLDLPERCRVLKLANSVTYDRLVNLTLYCGLAKFYIRMDKAIDQLEKIVLPSVSSIVTNSISRLSLNRVTLTASRPAN